MIWVWKKNNPSQVIVLIKTNKQTNKQTKHILSFWYLIFSFLGGIHAIHSVLSSVPYCSYFDLWHFKIHQEYFLQFNCSIIFITHHNSWKHFSCFWASTVLHAKIHSMLAATNRSGPASVVNPLYKAKRV